MPKKGGSTGGSEKSGFFEIFWNFLQNFMKKYFLYYKNINKYIIKFKKEIQIDVCLQFIVNKQIFVDPFWTPLFPTPSSHLGTVGSGTLGLGPRSLDKTNLSLMR